MPGKKYFHGEIEGEVPDDMTREEGIDALLNALPDWVIASDEAAPKHSENYVYGELEGLTPNAMTADTIRDTLQNNTPDWLNVWVNKVKDDSAVETALHWMWNDAVGANHVKVRLSNDWDIDGIDEPCGLHFEEEVLVRNVKTAPEEEFDLYMENPTDPEAVLNEKGLREDLLDVFNISEDNLRDEVLPDGLEEAIRNGTVTAVGMISPQTPEALSRP